jgi:photosystem II stability/assembly factor-like uncharacterized protein
MMTLTQLYALIETSLTRVGNNRVSAPEIKAVCNAIVAYYDVETNKDIIPQWGSSLNFNIDGSGDGIYCKYADTTGKLRIFQTKTDGNQGNVPPSDPAITSNSFWQEISASSASSIKEWTPGLYGPGLIIVYYEHSTFGRNLYLLLEPSRPFNSINIEAEISAGQWGSLPQMLGGSGSSGVGYLFSTLIDGANINANLQGSPNALLFLKTAQSIINVTLQNVVIGKHTLYIRKLIPGDVTVYITDTNGSNLNVVETVDDNFITLSGPQNKLFEIEVTTNPTIEFLLQDPTPNINGVSFVHPVDNNIIYGVASVFNPPSTTQVQIIKSTDGGATWLPYAAAGAGVKTLVAFDPTGQYGIIGDAANYNKTSDFGATWSSGIAWPKNGIFRVKVESSTNWYAFSNSSDNVFKTTNGGSSWSDVSIPVSVSNNVKFSFQLAGKYIVYDPGTRKIYKTLNAGVAWSNIIGDLPLGTTPGGIQSLTGIAFLSDTVIYLAGVDLINRPKIWKSTNGGANWIQVTIPITYTFVNDIVCLNNNLIIIGFKEGVYVSQNAGLNWTLIPLAISPAPSSGFSFAYNNIANLYAFVGSSKVFRLNSEKSLIASLHGVGSNNPFYNLTSPTTQTVGNLAAGSNITDLPIARILELILTGESVKIFDNTFDNTLE